MPDNGDNHYTHVSVEAIQYCIDHQIDLYLPANSTNILQPLDVGYFHILKTKLEFERLVLSLRVPCSDKNKPNVSYR